MLNIQKRDLSKMLKSLMLKWEMSETLSEDLPRPQIYSQWFIPNKTTNNMHEAEQLSQPSSSSSRCDSSMCSLKLLVKHGYHSEICNQCCFCLGVTGSASVMAALFVLSEQNVEPAGSLEGAPVYCSFPCLATASQDHKNTRNPHGTTTHRLSSLHTCTDGPL